MIVAASAALVVESVFSYPLADRASGTIQEMRRHIVKRLTFALVALLALLGVGLTTGSASATPNTGVIEVTTKVHVCGEVTLTFSNSTQWNFSADVRRPGEVGTPDQFSEVVADEGPLVGQQLGNRYNPVALPPGDTSTTMTFTEDQVINSIEYRVARGPEQLLFLDWVTVDGFKTDCEAPETTTPSTTTEPPTLTTTSGLPSTSTTTATTTPPIGTTSGSSETSITTTVSYLSCADVIARGKAPLTSGSPGYRNALDHDRDGVACERDVTPVASSSGKLPDTGASVGPLVWVGTLVLIAGSALVLLTARRRRGANARR